MYGLLALAALALAGLSEGTRLGLGAILEKNNVPQEGTMKNVKVIGDTVMMEKHAGGTVSITDAKLAKELHNMSEEGPARVKSKRTGLTQVKNLFARNDGCDYPCGEGTYTCSTINNGYGMCFCLKDCSPDGEECFSTCFPP